MMKKTIKFFAIGLVITLLGVGLFYGIKYFGYRTAPEYNVSKKLKELERQYAEDPYGGDTPEETLRLFINALKKGDTDLAAKYFVLDKQEEWRNELLIIKEKGLLDEMVRDVGKLNKKYPLVKNDPNRFIFEAYNEQKDLVMQADIAKGPNGKWKILDL
jgi:hypothetical protein